MSVNSRLKVTKTVGQRKAFYRQRIPEPSCMKKETVEIDILVTSGNGEGKRSRPTLRKGKYNKLTQFASTFTKVIPIENT